MAKAKSFPCVCAVGVGERNTEDRPCKMRDVKGRKALRCVFDADGRWMIHWREAEGEEWVGTYRLLPC